MKNPGGFLHAVFPHRVPMPSLEPMTSHDAESTTFTKRVGDPEAALAEAAGLRWLREATGAVVRVVEATEQAITTERVEPAQPTAQAARAFGAELARMHKAGAEAFGAPPAGWEGKNFIGTVEQACEPTDHWGEFYAHQRVLPFAERAGLEKAELNAVADACEAIAATDFDVTPARIHGDLWAGNVLFGSQGAVMIDPAAHGGHPHTDLGMLALFGAPYLDDIFAGYGAPEDIDTWIPMHQLHPLAVHAMTHGPAYNAPLARAARHTLKVLG